MEMICAVLVVVTEFEMCVETGDDLVLDCPIDCVSGCEMDLTLDGIATSVNEDFDCVWSVGGSRDGNRDNTGSHIMLL